MSRKLTGALSEMEMKVFSQNGEDGIIEYIFSLIPPKSKYFVELGVGDGSECNTRYLREKYSWRGLWIDCVKSGNSEIVNARLTRENVLGVFRANAVPRELDLLSVDLDSNDYWIASEILRVYSPRVMVVEYNASYPPPFSGAVTYDPTLEWEGTDYFGASLSAWHKMLSCLGFSLVGCDSRGVNAFFVKSTLMPMAMVGLSPEMAYRPPGYGQKNGGVYVGHRRDARRLAEV